MRRARGHAGLVMREYRHGAVDIVDGTSLSFFVLVLLTIVATGHDLFSNYRIIAAWGIFALVAWATLVAGFPFTLQYSRERVLREMWNATSFLTMNVIMTLVWAVIFTMDTILAARTSRPLRSITRCGDPNSHPGTRLHLQSFLSRVSL